MKLVASLVFIQKGIVSVGQAIRRLRGCMLQPLFSWQLWELFGFAGLAGNLVVRCRDKVGPGDLKAVIFPPVVRPTGQY